MHRLSRLFAIFYVIATCCATPSLAQTTTSNETAAKAATTPVGASSLGALRPIPETAPALTRGQLVAKFRRLVVMIRTPGKVTATGMVIGSDGIILSSADVATPTGRPTVAYVTQTGETIETNAEVLRTDPDTNLALLKIEPAAPLPTVRFDRSATISPNQRIHVLEYSQKPLFASGEDKQQVGSTTGLVYNPRLELSGKPYIHTSANIGGRSCGAPMFNTRGGVIGVVTTDTNRFGASAMAIPLDEVLAFLQAR